MKIKKTEKIIHVTTVHPRTDTRILIKEVATLSRVWPGEIALYVQDGKGNDTDLAEDVVVYDTGMPESGRVRRMTFGAFRMYRAIRYARPLIVHFHDPELLPWAMLLRFQGIKVIYDMHEDLPLQLLHKHYLAKPIARALAWFAQRMDKLAVRVLDKLIVVVPAMQERFDSGETVLIANFPSLAEFPVLPEKGEKERTKGRFVYVGGMADVRGVREMVDAIELVPEQQACLQLLGEFSDFQLRDQVRQQKGWQRVNFMGWCSRDEVVEELFQASAGLVLLHPTPQYVISYPVKLFEYMAAGLPVIASDFPLWREIIEGVGCGLLVDPRDPQGIADAMQWILDNPLEALEMGNRGRKSVVRRYNWEAESEKLIGLYRHLLLDN